MRRGGVGWAEWAELFIGVRRLISVFVLLVLALYLFTGLFLSCCCCRVRVVSYDLSVRRCVIVVIIYGGCVVLGALLCASNSYSPFDGRLG